jgi:hypothetical protein
MQVLRGMIVSFGNVIAFSGFLAMADAVDAQSVTGRVVGTGAAPLTGVRVSLSRLNLTVTTGADGMFELKLPNTAILPGQSSRAPRLTLRENGIEFPGGRDVLGKAMERPTAHNRVMVLETRDRVARALARTSAFAADDTITFSKTGWFTEKNGVPAGAAKNMGDVDLERDVASVGNIITDKFDRALVDSQKKYGFDTSMAMVLKAMLVIESSNNPNAISMYDVTLPCGTHSYGIIQATPGCIKGYATLPAGTKVTATISGGLNQVPATLTYADPADKAAGNTVVQENGIIINLVSNAANPLWPTSAFNPAYSIDHGAKVVSETLAQAKKNSAGCTESQYVALALSYYNQGFDGNNRNCVPSNANGAKYATNGLAQYRAYCKTAGVLAVY